jgi:hypothetical protein
VLYATVGANVAGYTDTGVVAGNTYYYRVYAYNTAGPSPYYSNEASAELQTLPASPTLLTAVGNASSIGLAWTDNANNEQGFRIDRKVGAAGTWGLYTSVGANVTSYTDTGVISENTYYYRVYAYNAIGNSVYYSNEASAAMAVKRPTWIVMYYMCNGNNLDEYIPGKFSTIAASLTSDVQVFMLVDRLGAGLDRVYRLKQDGDMNNYTDGVDRWTPSQIGLSGSEFDTGLTNTINAFTDFVVSKAGTNANHYALVIYNHGGGISPTVVGETNDVPMTTGIGWDENGNYLSVSELGSALAHVKALLKRNVEVLHLDACLMQMVEVNYQLRNSVDYLVASENEGWTSLQSFETYVAGISASTTAGNLAQSIADVYFDWSAIQSLGRTISVTRPGQVTPIVTAVDALALTLIQNIGAERANITTAQANAQKFAYQQDATWTMCPDNFFVDLRDFCEEVVQHSSVPSVQTAANAVITAIGSAGGSFLVSEQHSSAPGATQKNGFWFDQGTYGLSFFFPRSDTWGTYDNYINDSITPANLAFTASTSWDEFLRAYFSGTVQFDSTSYSISEDGGSVRIYVSRVGGASGAASVNYATANGTATAGSDYTTKRGTLSWADGDTASKMFSVTILDDRVYEGNETFKVNLSEVTGASLGSPSSATVTMVDNETPPPGAVQLSSLSYSLSEKGGTVTITATRTGGSFGAASVNYTTANGTATAGSDFTAKSGVLSWADGDSTAKRFDVTITNDSTAETPETFTVNLSGANGASLGTPSTATVTIMSEDVAPFLGTPWTLPGLVEMENFDNGGPGAAYGDVSPVNEGGTYRLGEGVDIARDTSAGNSNVVGWTLAGEWLKFTVNVSTSGAYTLQMRVAAVGVGGQFRIFVDEVDKTGLVNVPNTGAWSAYETVSQTGVALSSGVHTVKVSMVTAGASGNVGAFDWFKITAGATPVSQSAYPSGTPWALPGTMQAENFDNGGEGVACHDTTVANQGSAYRAAECVDIAADAGAGNGFVVGWTLAGEWLEYTVNIASSATYTLETRVASVGAGGQFRILVNGVDKTGLLSVPNTGAWNAYQTVSKTGVALSSGIQTVRVEMVTAGLSGNVGAFDWFRVVSTVAPPQSAYPSGTPWVLPGTVEIENFDSGGTGVAYSDATPANEGGQYRLGEGVDIARDTSAGNSNVVGWTLAGEWLEYMVNVGQSGTYTLDTRVAGVGVGGQFRILVNEVDKTGLLNVPNTGAWNAYQTVSKTGVALSSGIQTVRVEMVTAGPSGNVGAFDWFRVVSTVAPSQSAYPSGTPWVLPGTVEIENFDNGGTGVAYSDATPANEGGQYRLVEGVDIARDMSAGNSNVVGWTLAGEWMEYTVNVGQSGTYTLETRVAGVGVGGQFRILVNGLDKTGSLNVPNTGTWNAYHTVSKTGVALSSGIQTVRVEMVTVGPSGNVGAFDWFRVSSSAPLSVAAAGFTSAEVESPLPIEVETSEEAQQPMSGWLTVDGDTNTAWQAIPGAAGWWLALVYDPPISLNGVTLGWAPDSPTNVQYLYGRGTDDLTALELPLTNGPMDLNYLWLIFPSNNVGAPPAILEIHVK